VNGASRFYRFAQWLARVLWKSYGTIDVAGTEHVPASGPFLLICNHQSNLDPILIQAFAPRPMHAMAKSTQFAAPLVGFIMQRLLSFPVRRYQVDPQAVRMTLRYLDQGLGVCIYVEGERSWDGRLQKPRRGTLRLALRAGVPVIPCGIRGSYDAWPRWDSRIQPRHITITFGPPIPLPHLTRREDREAFLDEAGDRIMTALAALSGGTWPNPSEPAEKSGDIGASKSL
jgi:1-acyl-sn-glycerol-3-phosphate acyltransferase